LINNKDISIQELSVSLPLIKEVWSDALDFCEISFSYNPDKFAETIKKLGESLTSTLSPVLSEKTIRKFHECLEFLSQKELLDLLYINESQNEVKGQLCEVLRNLWNKAFLNEVKT